MYAQGGVATTVEPLEMAPGSFSCCKLQQQYKYRVPGTTYHIPDVSYHTYAESSLLVNFVEIDYEKGKGGGHFAFNIP